MSKRERHGSKSSRKADSDDEDNDDDEARRPVDGGDHADDHPKFSTPSGVYPILIKGPGYTPGYHFRTEIYIGNTSEWVSDGCT